MLPALKDLVIVAGHAGSGKTLLSSLVANRLGWAVLDKDTITLPLVEALAENLTGNPNDRESDTYLENIRPLEYQALLGTAWDILDSGMNGVMMVAPFGKELRDPSWVAEFQDLCARKGVNLTIAWVHCGEEKKKERIQARDTARDMWKLDNWDQWYQSLPQEPPPINGMVILDNNDDSPDALEANARSLIAAVIPRYGETV